MNDVVSAQNAPADESEGGASPYQMRSNWHRVFFTLICGLLYAITRIVVTAVVVFQIVTLLIIGHPNRKLMSLGGSLARYTYQLVRYLTFVTERRPFPFDLNWPTENGVAEKGVD